MKRQYQTLLCCFTLFTICSCHNTSHKNNTVAIPEFPYQAFLNSVSDDSYFPIIGDDGDGFNAICHKIRYPKIPLTLHLSHFADSLLQIYNICLAYNSIAYDTSTAERYIEESDSGLHQADALDAINLSGIHNHEIRNLLSKISKQAAYWIRDGKLPNEQRSDDINRFYEQYHTYSHQVQNAHVSDEEFDPNTVIKNYNDIHKKAISDTLKFRDELLMDLLLEPDFSKKCVLAREFAYSNYISPHRDDIELVAVLDYILKTNQYSPLLGEIWLMWRTALQKNIFGGPSNDSAMYNLFYNDMRNRIALVYIDHLNRNPNDNIAFKEFMRLGMEHNITRNSGCYFGNNSILDEMNLYEECWKK